MVEKRMDAQVEEKADDCKNNVTKSKKVKRVVMWTVGIGVPTLLAIAFGIKNKDVIGAAWATMKEEFERRKLFTPKWFEKVKLEELYERRDPIQAAYMNPETDPDIRNECWVLLGRIDKKISDLKSQGKDIGFPVSCEHGWYLQSKD